MRFRACDSNSFQLMIFWPLGVFVTYDGVDRDTFHAFVVASEDFFPADFVTNFFAYEMVCKAGHQSLQCLSCVLLATSIECDGIDHML